MDPIRTEKIPPRRELPVLETDPKQGLTEAEVQQRVDGGWANVQTVSASRTEKEIILLSE